MVVAGRQWGLRREGPTRAMKSYLEQRETPGSDRASPRTLEWTHHPSPSCPARPVCPKGSLKTLIHWLGNFSNIKKRMKSDFKLLQSFSSDKTCTNTTSCLCHNSPVRWVWETHCTDGQTESQEGPMTCPRVTCSTSSAGTQPQLTLCHVRYAHTGHGSWSSVRTWLPAGKMPLLPVCVVQGGPRRWVRFLCETVSFAVSSTTDSTPRLAPASTGCWSSDGVLVGRGWRGGRRGPWGTDRQADRQVPQAHPPPDTWDPSALLQGTCP